MRAIVQTGYGGPDVLELRDEPVPEPKAGEVLVRIHASDVTSGDARMRAFNVPGPFRLPARLVLGITRPRFRIPGVDFAGEVVRVGDGVSRFKPGVRVFGQQLFRCHAEYRCVPAEGAIALIPGTMSDEDAAALPFGTFTALDFFRRAGLKPGNAILINGASGAVGIAAVQVAHHLGAEVTAVCSTRNAELVRKLGAADVLDYTAPGFALPSRAFDMVFDTVGSLGWALSEPALKPAGKLLAAVSDWPVLFAQLRHGKRIIGGSGTPGRADAEEMARLVLAGVLRPVIDSVFDLADIRAAHLRVDTGHKVGAVVVRV